MGYFDLLDGRPQEAAPILRARQAARQLFDTYGLPTHRTESFRFSKFEPLVETGFAASSQDDVGQARLDAYLAGIEANLPGADRIVLVNGRYDAGRSHAGELPTGVYFGATAQWAAANPAEAERRFQAVAGAENAFLTLNAGLYSDGAVLIVPEGVTLPRPVLLVSWGEAAKPAVSHVRSLIQLGANAAAEIIELAAGEGLHWLNAAVTVELGVDAKLSYVKLLREAPSAFHTAYFKADLASRASLDAFILTAGSGLSRQEFAAVLGGPGASATVNGAYLLQGRQEGSVLTLIDHASPNAASAQTFKACLAERAHGIFQGRIDVRENASKTDARQLAKTLLVGPTAVIDVKPELVILTDDVVCAHGASVGDLDETSLFYLLSRGIEPGMARRMLIEAFVADVVELIPHDAARALTAASVAQWLAEAPSIVELGDAA